jgi:peptidoglycan-associated lipoprotein
MRILKLLFIVSLVVALGACSCRTRRVGAGDDNLPIAAEGSDLKDVHFAFDSYALDSTAKSILKDNASWLSKNSSVRVQVEGHCDERGTNEYNMVLGANRARAAKDYLRSLGVADSRLSTVSYGEELPLDPGHNETAWAKNRRAHFNTQK